MKLQCKRWVENEIFLSLFISIVIAVTAVVGVAPYVSASPDKQIDASTCLSPDTTWFIKNLEHTYFPDCVNGLVSDIVNNKDFTIDSNPEYPQYLGFDDATQTISPMVEENMNTTERYETSFIDALFTFFKSVFALIIG